MIVFDLQCANGHRFEGWFDDGKDYEDQAAGGLLVCPVCEDTRVAKLPSCFSIRTTAEPQNEEPRKETAEFSLVKQVLDYVEKNFENVGSGFTREALKIHYGVAEPRNIRGSSTKDEEDTLSREGVPFFKFPVPSSDDSDA